MQYWLNNQFCRLVFSFYVWEETLDQLKKEILLWGGLEIVINALSAILAILGIVGTQKRTPLLLRLFSVGVGVYLAYWAARVIFLAKFSQDFTLSDGVAWAVTILLAIALVVFLTILANSLAYSLYLKLRKEKEEAAQVIQLFRMKVKNEKEKQSKHELKNSYIDEGYF